MRVFFRFVLACCGALFLVSTASAQTQSSVWLVSEGENKMYVAGTLHLLGAGDYPLPEVFDIAFESSQIVVFETDIGALQLPETQLKLQSMVMLPPGKTLQNSISNDTYEKLTEYLTSAGLHVAHFQHIKPSMVAMTITVLAMQRLGLGEMGVDQFYYERAVRNMRRVDGLESLDAHLAYVAGMGEGNEDEFLRYTIDDMENLAALVDEMVVSWRAGDIKALDAIAVEPMRKEFSELYETLLVERNNNWLPKLEAMMQTPEVELVLVGAAHLAGADSVLTMLEDKGYRVEQLGLPAATPSSR